MVERPEEENMQRNIVRTVVALVAFGMIAASACDDPTVAPDLDAPAGPTATRAAEVPGLIVSAARGLVTTTPHAFVSLLPGSDPTGTAVVVRNARTGRSVQVPLTDGGFDPVSVPATSEDPIRVEIQSDAEAPLTASSIPILLPPVVIRTDPPKHRTSVPLNTLLTIVFSEPIDPASVTAEAITLTSAYGDAEVTFSMREEGTVVDVQPVAPLRALTEYTLRIGTAIRDLSGEALPEAETVTFLTAPCVVPDTVPFFVRILPDTLMLPVGSYSGFIVAVDSGARIINVFPDTSLTWATTDASIVSMDWTGGVGGVAIGEAYVTVEYQGVIDSALVIVTDSPPPGPFGLFPGGASIPIGFELRFEVTHPAGTEPPQVTWSTTDASILVVDDTGVVTAVAAGSAYVVVTDGVETDSAQVDVYDSTPALADLYVIYPDSLLLQVGDTRQLEILGPERPAPPSAWSFSNEGVVSVNDDGLLTALATGTTEIIATFSDGSSTRAFAEVVPAGSLGSITLVPDQATAAVGDTVRFTIAFDTTAAALWGNETPSWGTRSPDGLVLQFLASGVFEAVAEGTVEVRAYVGPLIATASVSVTP
jgi:uncharacterized protein YjdB